MFDKGDGIQYNTTRVIARCTMILNVNRILHTPGASQDFHFEMDLSDMEFGGEKPVVHPVAVDGRVYNQAGVLLCELQASTTLRCVCDRCMEEFDSPKTASFSCILAEEKQDQENDDIVLLDHDEVDVRQVGDNNTDIYVRDKQGKDK